jgi:hypothetical protein
MANIDHNFKMCEPLLPVAISWVGSVAVPAARISDQLAHISVQFSEH